MKTTELTIFGEQQSFETLIDNINYHVRHHPNKEVITFLRDGETEADTLTYASLFQNAQKIANELLKSAKQGDRAILVFQNSLEFVNALLGCFYAGIVAVPVFPPQARKAYWERLEKIAFDCDATLLVSTAEYLENFAARSEGMTYLNQCAQVAVDKLNDDSVFTVENKHAITPENIAFLQYTSGSTGDPKGVIVTHHNVLHNVQSMAEGFQQNSNSILVSWLPMFHDMGLIGNLLLTICLGARCYLMSPSAFLQKPVRWLNAVSRYKATTCYAPNFAYELVTKRASNEDLAQLDLRSWTLALNGAEPIKPETLTQFQQKFAACGLPESSIFPAYGLAENTLFVAGSDFYRPFHEFSLDVASYEESKRVISAKTGKKSRTIVSVGKPCNQIKVEIVCPESHQQLQPGQVGEIWVSGDSVAKGYWNKPLASKETFQARMRDQDDETHYMRTGDFGFLLDGLLYVSGRMKEVIIIRGSNYYPQDIEKLIQSVHPALKDSGGAAFCLEQQGEQSLVAIQEVERTWLKKIDTDDVIKSVKQAVFREFGLNLSDFVLIKPASLNKTSSGKIQRNKAAIQYRDDTLREICRAGVVGEKPVEHVNLQNGLKTHPHKVSKAAQDLVPILAMILSQSLEQPVPENPAETDLINMGLDSVSIASFFQHVSTMLNVQLPLAVAGEINTLMDLAVKIDVIRTGNKTSPETDEIPSTQVTARRTELSANQAQMWHQYQRDPKSAAYNVPLCLKGPFDINKLQQALENTVQQFDLLQVRFEQDKEIPFQVQHNREHFFFTVEDLSELNEQALINYLSQSAQQPFDLEHSLPYRFNLFTHKQHVLLLCCFHHIIVDLSSIQLFYSQLMANYESVVSIEGNTVKNDIEIKPYSTFIEWQQAYANRIAIPESDAFIDQQFWASLYQDLHPTLQLPLDHKRQAIQSYQGLSLDFSFSEALSANICHQAKLLGVSNNAYLTACFQVFLHKISNQDNFNLGTMLSGRSQTDHLNILGYFVQPAVLKFTARDFPNFDALAVWVHKQTKQYIQHQAGAIHALNQLTKSITPVPGVPNVFQSLFSYYSSASGSLASIHGEQNVIDVLDNKGVQLVKMPSLGAQLDLSLLVCEASNQLHGRFEYNSSLFSQSSIKRFAKWFIHIVTQVSQQEDNLKLAEINLTTPIEQEQLNKLNLTDSSYSGLQQIHLRIREQAARTPNHTAITFENQTLSYSELQSRTDQISHLIMKNKSVGDYVGIFMERGLDLIPAMLGAMQCGKAYVPIAPDAPVKRIESILKQAKIDLILTNTAVSTPFEGVTHIDLSHVTSETIGFQPHPVCGNSLAYMIFTSGSTGEPKGVMNTHEALFNRLVWMQQAYELSDGDVFIQKTPIMFDVSVWELFLPLLIGAKVVLAKPEGHKDATYIQGLIEAESISAIHFVPSMLENYLQSIDSTRATSLNKVFCSGEALPCQLTHRFYQQFPDCELHNLYGPTEAAIDVSYWDCAGDSTRVPIGYPIANTQLYILDKHLNQVPIGITGELYIAGINLARGYIAKPELTSSCFVPNPFSKAPGTRMYRTGDLAKYLDNGAIEYLGRNDHQIKLRGFRIELGEVDAVLTRVSGVNNGCCIVTDVNGQQALVAYYVGHIEEHLLREKLAESLPSYMLPSLFIKLSSLPTSVNGKLDRKALPQPNAINTHLVTNDFRTVKEQHVAQAWSNVTGVETSQIGRETHFFEIGGHSLLAAKVVAELKADWHYAISVSDVFKYARLADFARQLSTEDSCSIEQQNKATSKLSASQKRLWLINELEGYKPSYNIPLTLQLDGKINVAALRQAYQTLVARHDILHSVYRKTEASNTDIEPLMCRLEEYQASLQIFDWSTMTETVKDNLNYSLVEFAKAPFNLANDIPIRAALYLLPHHTAVISITMHHIAADGHSLDIIARELGELYYKSCHQLEEELPCPTQFSDYVSWLDIQHNQEQIEQDIKYWQNTLENVPSLLALPNDKIRPKTQNYLGGAIAVKLEAELVTQLKAYAASKQTTFYIPLLTAFYIALAKFSNQNDIVIGSPFSTRDQKQVEQVIGFFIETIVLRINGSDSLTISQTMQLVQETYYEVLEHQSIGFEQIVDISGVERTLASNPLFQALLNLQPEINNQEGWQELHVEPYEIAYNVAKFDVAYMLTEGESGVYGYLEFNRDVFSTETIEQLNMTFINVLSLMLKAPDKKINRLTFVNEQQSETLKKLTKPEKLANSECRLIHEVFDAVADANPDATAVICQEKSYSYRELSTSANLLSGYFKTMGVEYEDAIAISSQRSYQQLVTILAVLKCGAFYVPIDANNPTATINKQLKDIHAKLYLVEPSVVSADKDEFCCDVVLSMPEAMHLSEKLDQPQVETSPISESSRLAYVMYTSGTTGEPKGTAVPHRAITNLVNNPNYMSLTADTKMLYAAPLAFDASTLEIWGPLLNGGVVVVCEEHMLSTDGLSDKIQRFGVNSAWLTASLFKHLVDENVSCFEGLNQLIVGGDVVSKAHVEKTINAVNNIQLINGYGPTENTTFSTHFPIELDKVSTTVPIGYSLNGCETYVLDEHLNLLPPGAIGTLYVAGEGLARGYINLPLKTAEKFLPNPFSDEPGSLMYHTGDNVRINGSGALEFIGRDDHQVKIRGFRIELDELNETLSLHDDVASAASIIKQKNEDSYLVSFVTTTREIEPDAIKLWLKAKVPNYMVPRNVVVLDKLPLTRNGKLDRKALDAIEVKTECLMFDNELNEQQLKLAHIWRELLAIEVGQIGLNSDFFSLGGHSILAAKLVHLIQIHYGCEISLRDVFENPQLSDLAWLVNSTCTANKIELIKSIDACEASPLSHAQSRLWFLNQLEGPNSAYNIPLVLKFQGNVDCAKLTFALTKLIEKHQILRSTYQSINDEPHQVIAEQFDFSVEMLIVDDEVQALDEIFLASTYCFDLVNELPIQVKLIQSADDVFWLSICIHHIAADGWSMDVIKRELAFSYLGNKLPTSDLHIQYIDYVNWYNTWFTEEKKQKQLTYWLDKLKGADPIHALPTDFARPPMQTHQGRCLPLEIPTELTRQIKHLSATLNTSVFTTLSTIFSVVIAKYSNQQDIVFGTPVANRPHQQLQDLIGFFVNTLAIRAYHDDTQSFQGCLANMKQTMLEAFEHQDLPFEHIVDALQIDRGLSYSPVFQVLFSYAEQKACVNDWGDISVKEHQVQHQSAKFDMSLMLQNNDSNIIGFWEYSTDLYTQSTIENMWQAFLFVAKQVVADPTLSFAELALQEKGKSQLFYDNFNATHAVLPGNKNILQCFLSQVVETPDAIALESEMGRLSFQELDKASSQLASCLQCYNLSSESPVAIHISRSIEHIVTMLAVLKIGGCYLPLDPKIPEERKQYIVSDANVALIIHQGKPVLKVNVEQLNFDIGQHASGNYKPLNLACFDGLQLAYMMYTSGSTGQPKGTQITHEAVLRLAFNNGYANLKGGRRILHSAPPEFDASTFEIWAALLNGGTCIVYPNEVPTSQTYKRIVSQYHVDTVFLTTSLFNYLVDEDCSCFEGIQQLLTGGDFVSKRHFTRFKSVHNQCVLTHVYGPTEATTFATGYKVSKDIQHMHLDIPIGFPIDNTSTYVLDSNMNPVPLGVIGELYIGGCGLSRGYLNKADKTAAVFVPNPFADGEGERLYKTGDHVFHAPDGAINFVGRIDHQVKLRGFRIELSEIESVLTEHEYVNDCTVLLNRKTAQGPALIAYLTLNTPECDWANASTCATEATQFLQNKLPEYMIPPYFVVVPQIPITSNGKVDRKALALIEPTVTTQQSGEAPVTETEQTLQDIWQEVLGLTNVGRQSNFFNLGGHSLLAAKMSSRLSSHFSLDISVKDIFLHPELSRLAELIDSHLWVMEQPNEILQDEEEMEQGYF